MLSKQERSLIQSFLDNCDDNYKRIPVEMNIQFKMQHKRFPENKGSISISLEGINSSRLMGKFINQLADLAKEIRDEDNFQKSLNKEDDLDFLS